MDEAKAAQVMEEVGKIKVYLSAIKRTKPPNSIRWRICAIENALGKLIELTGRPAGAEISYSEGSDSD
jgi:hypothetical protein